MKYRKMSFYLTAYGKYFLLASIVFLLVFGTSVPVYASETDEIVTSDMSSDTVYTVTEIQNSNELSNLAPFEITRRVSSQDTGVLGTHIRANDLEAVNATITDNTGNSSVTELIVAWDFSQVDTSVCGEYTATGTIRLPDASYGSYQWGEDVISVIVLTIIVSDSEEPVTIVRLDSYESDYNMYFSLELNADVAAFEIPLQQTCRCYDASGHEYASPVIYNREAVRTDEVGIYHISVTFEAPSGCRFSEELNIPTYSIPVTVQAPGQPRLDLSYIGTFTGFIYFPWITSGIDLSTMEIWVSENEGEWRMMELYDEVNIYSNSLDIDPYMMTVGNSYRIQAKYEGGQTGIASFTYGWDVLSDKEYIEGDRDGGDTDGNPPEDSTNNENTIIIPPENSTNNENTSTIPPEDSTNNENTSIIPPEDSTNNDYTNVIPPEDSTNDENTDIIPPKDSASNEHTNVIPPKDSINNENTSIIPPEDSTNNVGTDSIVSTPVKEDAITVEEDTLSERTEPYLLGSEIALMLENLGTARFSAETIMLDIPTDTIASLVINDTDRLLVTILPLKNNGFSVDIAKNDVAITKLPSMQISMPYQPPENTTPVLINEISKEASFGEYNPDTGLVTFTIQETGTFYIKDVKAKGQDSLSVNTLTATEVSDSDKANELSVFKLITIVATVVICSAGATLFMYKKKRRR